MGVFSLHYRLFSDLSPEACLSRLSGFSDEESLGGLIDFLLTGDQRTQFFVRIRRNRFWLQPKEDPFPFGSTFFAGKLKPHRNGTMVKLRFCYHRLTILLSLASMAALTGFAAWRVYLLGWSTAIANPVDASLLVSLGFAAMIGLWWLYFLWERRQVARQILGFLRATLNLKGGWM